MIEPLPIPFPEKKFKPRNTRITAKYFADKLHLNQLNLSRNFAILAVPCVSSLANKHFVHVFCLSLWISKLLKSIPGIGEIAAQVALAELPDLSEFEDARQLAAWAGLTPQHRQSGTSGRTNTPITKIGSAHLRRGLFMPAMTARLNNPLLKAFGDRLKENGKKQKQIIIAIMRKLLHQIYGILKSGQPYNPEKRGFAGA